MTLEVLILIVDLCSSRIEPRFIEDVCAENMVICIQEGQSFDDCSSYWEPHYGDPGAADLSY